LGGAWTAIKCSLSFAQREELLKQKDAKKIFQIIKKFRNLIPQDKQVELIREYLLAAYTLGQVDEAKELLKQIGNAYSNSELLKQK